MSFPKLQITEAGKVALIKALSGENLVFTCVKAGNGEAPENIFNLTELQNPLLRLNINSIEQGDGCVSLEAAFDNANIEAGFHWSEIGVFVEDGENSEVLYAYAHAGEHAEYIPQYSDTSFLKTTINVVVAVGDAENITAILGEYSGYAGKEEFDNHVNDNSNPHNVTPAQIGLGNVQNVSVNNASPTYIEADRLETLESGERTATAFGKIKRAISSLISHLSASNPHNITVGKIGAAKSTHTHSTNDIIKGVLGTERGGTGSSSLPSILSFAEVTSHKVIPAGHGEAVEFTVPTIANYTPIAIVPRFIGLHGVAGSPNAGIYSITSPRQAHGFVLVNNRENTAQDIEVNLLIFYIKYK